MACYHPIPAYQGNPGDQPRLWPPVGTANLDLPCGNCLGCLTDRATDWAHRAQMEASSWQHNSFITLTYDEDHLPHNGHLRPADLQKFIKRLRRAIDRKTPEILNDPRPGHPQGIRPVRYLASGEYGDRTLRPHFHLLLFNCTFRDAKAVGKNLRESPTLTKLWRKGAHRIGDLTGASANYVAQYSLKKLALPGERCDDNGEAYMRPFIRMSLKPPIGQTWTERFATDLQQGYLKTHDRKNRIPRGIRKQLAKLNPHLADESAFNASKHPKTKHDLQAAEATHIRHNQLTHQRHL